jgi:hypothetical protein
MIASTGFARGVVVHVGALMVDETESAYSDKRRVSQAGAVKGE